MQACFEPSGPRGPSTSIPSVQASTMPDRIASRLSVLLLAALPCAAIAEEATYSLDPVHTRVMVAVSHAGFSNPMGTVSGSTGTFVFDPEDWSRAQVEAKVPIDRLDFGDEKWNKAVLGHNFLDAKDHPVATFVSTRVEPVDATHATVIGNLTLRGVTREVKLDVVFHQAKRHPMPPFRYTAGFSATATLSRRVFAITAYEKVVGDEIELRIEAEGARSRDEMPGTTEPAPPSSVPSATSVNLPPASEPDATP
jgi:polyisoprenoid-binding protein YceI